MSLQPQLGFSGGELDPRLYDNVTLEKFKKALATCRNTMVSKSGTLISRFPRKFAVSAKNPNQPIKIYQPPNSDRLLEWGLGYVRIYSTTNLLNPYNYDRGDLGLQIELAHAIGETYIQGLQFDTAGDFVYVFNTGSKMLKLRISNGVVEFVPTADVFAIPIPPTSITVGAVGVPSGYLVDYAATLVINGEESDFVEIITGYAKPIAAGQVNNLEISWVEADVDFTKFREARIYSRPRGGGAYGYLGSTTQTLLVGLNRKGYFQDVGELPDYTNGMQDLISKYGLDGTPIDELNPSAGIVYQQRLIINTQQNREAMLASRPGFTNNFYRDFPNASDSALNFKNGTSGRAYVLRFIENDGLIAFTTNGIYTNGGVLGPDNLAMDRRGRWVINSLIPPLVIPGGVFFVDNSNVIRQLIFSQEIQAYETVEQSIFSNHLFKKNTIKSWCYQKGINPVIIVTFTNGTFATFTYSLEHQMRAWTRHDSVYPIEQVEGCEENYLPDTSFFVVNKNGNRSIEYSLPRDIPAEVYEINSENDKLCPNAFMDSIRSRYQLINEIFDVDEKFLLTPTIADEWESDLTLSTTYPTFPVIQTVGDIFRWFNPEDQTSIDLKVKSIVNATSVIVQPSEKFPSEYADDPRIYKTYVVIDFLEHLEGEFVSVMVDGAVISSPNNDDGKNTNISAELFVVKDGQITLPEEYRGAIIHVGRPITADIKTLNVSTVEQSPTMLESLTVNKLYIRVHETRGLYCSNRFPEEILNEKDGNTVKGMEDLDDADLDLTGEIIGNRPIQPKSKRIERTIPGEWNSQGQISIRQVDPVHFEILSIISDVEIEKRYEMRGR